ncbi:hypothetical protein FSP39_008984 [Pinctada imbricata]|uniref:Uncharacterized protein n=1 Tax=Pinctada imbricata TaxID=66713 RepID=A0AA88XZU5_PINIB|nr:hypothetical protein FSP39_008984 [Pinctada imbricata]
MPRYYVDNAYNRRIGRVGLPVGSFVVSKNSSFGSSGKTYVDNAYNRALGRVGMPHGSMVVSRDGSVSYNSTGVDKTYVDNAYNRSLGRVGMPHGSMVVSRESSAKTATTKTKQSPAGLSDPTQDSNVNPRRNTDDTYDDNVNSSSGIHATTGLSACRMSPWLFLGDLVQGRQQENRNNLIRH